MTKATISSKGQIAIPKAVRERLRLNAGTELSIDVQGEVLVMKRMVRNYPDWRTMRGMFRGANLLKDLADDRATEIARDNARIQASRV
jgi:AbrB family looped-hinge helix DNA binding protein